MKTIDFTVLFNDFVYYWCIIQSTEKYIFSNMMNMEIGLLYDFLYFPVQILNCSMSVYFFCNILYRVANYQL